MVVLSKQQKIITVSIAILLDHNVEKEQFQKKKRKSKRFWVRKLFKERKSAGFFHALKRELEILNREYFFRFLRMSPDRYKQLLSIVDLELQRQRTHLHEPMSPSKG